MPTNQPDLPPFALLVFGGRTYGVPRRWFGHSSPDERARDLKRVERESRHLNDTLDVMHRERKVSLLITGAADGADLLAESWARRNAVPYEGFPADWSTHGRSAGPQRNLVMAARLVALSCTVLEGYDVLGLGFPGGHGTKNMLAQLRSKALPSRACCESHPLPELRDLLLELGES
jgi:hypothetical protein